jgi:hypothetical protein
VVVLKAEEAGRVLAASSIVVALLLLAEEVVEVRELGVEVAVTGLVKLRLRVVLLGAVTHKRGREFRRRGNGNVNDEEEEEGAVLLFLLEEAAKRDI